MLRSLDLVILKSADFTLANIDWRALLSAGVVGVSLVSLLLWKKFRKQTHIKLAGTPVNYGKEGLEVNGKVLNTKPAEQCVPIYVPSITLRTKSAGTETETEEEEIDKLIDLLVRFLTGTEGTTKATQASSMLDLCRLSLSREQDKENQAKELERKLLNSKAPTCGFAEILMPTGQQTIRSESLTVKTPIQRYRIQDLQENARESEKTVERLKSILREQEAACKRLINEKDSLIAQSVEEEAIRCQAEAAATMMQVQIDTLHQGIQDYNMRTNDLVSQLKQLSLELRLIEIMNGEEQDEEKSKLIQSILDDMKAEITREEADLAGLREVNQKLRKEAEQDEARRLKYELELQKQIDMEISYRDESWEYDDYSFEEPGEDSIWGFSALRASTQLRASNKLSSTGTFRKSSRGSLSSDESWTS